MKLIHLSIAATLLSIASISCKKATTDEKTTISTNVSRKNIPLIRTLSIPELNGTGQVFYNADSTIKQINYAGSNHYSSVYSYLPNRAVSEINIGPDIFKINYTYNNLGQLITMTKGVHSGPGYATQVKLDYTYFTNGTLATIKYYLFNGATATLVYTTSYEYDTQDRPTKIVSVDKDGDKIIKTIEGYSSEIKFDPIFFMVADFDENYTFYNYPVLSKIYCLPTRIVESRVTNNAAPVIAKTTTYTYTITDGKLEKSEYALQFTAFPQYNTSSQNLYTY